MFAEQFCMKLQPLMRLVAQLSPLRFDRLYINKINILFADGRKSGVWNPIRPIATLAQSAGSTRR